MASLRAGIEKGFEKSSAGGRDHAARLGNGITTGVAGCESHRSTAICEHACAIIRRPFFGTSVRQSPAIAGFATAGVGKIGGVFEQRKKRKKDVRRRKSKNRELPSAPERKLVILQSSEVIQANNRPRSHGGHGETDHSVASSLSQNTNLR